MTTDQSSPSTSTMSGSGDKPTAIIFGALPLHILPHFPDPLPIYHRWHQHLFPRPRRLASPSRRSASGLGMLPCPPVHSHRSNTILAPSHRGQVFRVPSHNVSALFSTCNTRLILICLAILGQNSQKFYPSRMSNIAKPILPSLVSHQPSGTMSI